MKTAGSAEWIRDSGQPGDRTPAEPEDVECGATCIYIGRRCRKSETVGRPADPAPVAPKDERREVTQISIAGADLEMQNPGKPGNLAQGAERVSA